MSRLTQIFNACFMMMLACISSSALAQQAPTEQQIRQARLAPPNSALAQSTNANNSVDVSQFIQSEGNSIGRDQMVNIPQPNALAPVGQQGLPPPYGANLFQGGFASARGDGLNSAYRVAPGDKISIQIWGKINRADIVTVDNQGNIFITDVGPVTVKDVPANKVNALVTRKIKTIYTNNVNVYVNLLTATPVSVYVAGPVLRPGQYAGLASDSVLFYLKRAGGIDPFRGSYRSINILRENELIAQYDLYDFLREGKLESFSFKDQDVILVQEQGPMVTVEGSARYPFRFELESTMARGDNLMFFARPLAKTSHVAITGDRSSGPVSVYLAIEEFADFEVVDGDTVLFNDDLRAEVISVEISGSYRGPSFYTLKRNARLLDVLSHIEVDLNEANYGAVFIKRESVVEQQRKLINDALDRLERSIFTAPATSDGEARIRAQEAQLVSQFVARARQIEPMGKVVVAENGKVANIRLEQGDEIVIPAHTDLIQVAGEVLMPKAIVYNPEASISDYIAWSGGFSDRANDDRIAIVRANGITEFYDAKSSSRKRVNLQAGDQILVLPKIDTKVLQAVKDVTQIIYQIAIAANVVR